MYKSSSALSRVLWLMFWTILGISVVFFALSSYFFGDIYAKAHLSSLDGALEEEKTILERYAQGDVGREDLSAMVNPPLSVDNGFYLLTDSERRTLACTEGAEDCFTADAVTRMLEELPPEGGDSVRAKKDDVTILVKAERTPWGYAAAGRTLRAFDSAAMSFRNRLFISMLLAAALVLLLNTLLAQQATRPSALIRQMATQVARGERAAVPENLPGKDIREIAAALNEMSLSIARAMGDLKYEKETMALILEGLQEGILAIDGDGNILHENAAAWRLLGNGETESYRMVMAALREDSREEQWFRRFPDGGRVLHCAVSRLPREEGKESRGTVALIRDVTEEEHLERTRRDYVANISHELRTPLSSIRGLAEGLRDGMVTEEKDRERYYSIIAEESTRLSRLVNDLLELSSLQANPAAFETERVDPRELLEEIHGRDRRLFEQAELQFSLALPEGALPCVLSNEDRLAQVLTIFLDNARKYTPAGGCVTLGAEDTAVGVRFFVRDNGIGMDAETCRLAFERFHQAERSHSGKGSGLGLSIAREILRKMNVTIHLRSAPGEGSEFSFVIPSGG